MPVDFLGALALPGISGTLRNCCWWGASQKQEGEQLCPTAATLIFSIFLCCLALIGASACFVVLSGFVGVDPQISNYAKFELARMVSL